MEYGTTFIPKKRSSRLLLVDDDLAAIKTVGTILKKAGYQINVARDGRQGLEVIAKTPPDLILSDLEMPKMNGIDFCRAVHSNHAMKDIPFLFLSGSREIEDIVEGLKAGAVDYIFKPFNYLELLTRLDTHLSLRETRLRYDEDVPLRVPEDLRRHFQR
ncbi:MAG: response regulator [Limisphaerales bacterium]